MWGTLLVVVGVIGWAYFMFCVLLRKEYPRDPSIAFIRENRLCSAAILAVLFTMIIIGSLMISTRERTWRPTAKVVVTTKFSPDAEKALLLRFKDERSIHLREGNHVLNSWSTTSSMCDWLGVVCTSPTCSTTCGEYDFDYPPAGHVVALQLADSQITGTLPPYFTGLQYLQSIDFTRNSLTGTLPEEWGALQLPSSSNNESCEFREGHCAIIEFGQTNYNTWGSCRLRTRYMCGTAQPAGKILLSGNKLRGTIPGKWGYLRGIVRIDLSYNTLSGVLPRGWKGLPWTIQSLDLNNNMLVGPLPNEWAKLLAQMELRLDLSHNSLSGTLPSRWISAGTYLEIDLQDNRLTGTVPIWASYVRSMDLRYNDLTGFLPEGAVDNTLFTPQGADKPAPPAPTSPPPAPLSPAPWWISTWLSFILAFIVGVIGAIVAVALKGAYQHSLVLMAMVSCGDIIFDVMTSFEMIHRQETVLAAASFSLLSIFFVLDLICLLHTEHTSFPGGFMSTMGSITPRVLRHFPEVAQVDEDSPTYSPSGNLALTAVTSIDLFVLATGKLMSAVLSARNFTLTTLLLPVALIVGSTSIFLALLFFSAMFVVMVLESDTAAESMVGRMPTETLGSRGRVLITFEGLRFMQDMAEMVIEINYGIKTDFSSTTIISLILGVWQMFGRALAVSFYVARGEVDVIVQGAGSSDRGSSSTGDGHAADQGEKLKTGVPSNGTAASGGDCPDEAASNMLSNLSSVILGGINAVRSQFASSRADQYKQGVEMPQVPLSSSPATPPAV